MASLLAIAVMLAACASSGHESVRTLPSAEPQGSGPSTAAALPAGGTDVISGGVGQSSPVEGQQITPVQRRSTGAISLRTFVTKLADYSSNCDRTSQMCVPAWCEVQGAFVVELSDPAMVATQSAEVIGLAAGSRMSLLSSAVVGTAEGSPVTLVTARVTPDIVKVELATPGGIDAVEPRNGLVALAVAGSAEPSTLRAFVAGGEPIQTLEVADGPTVQSAACRPQPILLPTPGTPPADPKAAEAAIRDAYLGAYQHGEGTGPYSALEHVQDGAALKATVDQARKNFPTAASTITVSTGALVFTSPTTAEIEYSLDYTGGAPFSSRNGQAVLVAGKWLVGRATYCALLAWAAATCPAA